MDNYPVFKKPALVDRLIAELQVGLKAHIPWLDNAFGRTQRLQEKANDGKNYFYPAVWKSGKTYEPMFPDKGKGNFCFFKLTDPQEVNKNIVYPGRITYPASIIFWFDTQTIEEGDERNTEAIKEQILQALKSDIKLRSGWITISRIWEDAENVYRDYTISQIEDQYAMQPYGAMRFDIELTVDAVCVQ